MNKIKCISSNSLRIICLIFYLIITIQLFIIFFGCSSVRNEFDGQWKVIHYGDYANLNFNKEVEELFLCENAQIEIFKSKIYGDCECSFFSGFTVIDSIELVGPLVSKKIRDRSPELIKELQEKIPYLRETSIEWYSTRVFKDLDLVEINLSYLIKIDPGLICLVVNENFLVLKKAEL